MFVGGACFAAELVAIIGVEASLCYFLDDDGNSDFFLAAGFGVGWGQDVGIQAIVSNADTIHDMAGWSASGAVGVALGVEVTAGGIVAASAPMAKDLEPTYAAILAAINEASVVTMDETGWRIGGLHAWLWTATTTTLTAFTVAEGRGFDDACRLVNELFDGTLIRDGWAPYLGYTKATHQSCVAHLLRRSPVMIETLPGHERGLARDVKDLLIDALGARNLDTAELRAAAAEDFTERLQLLLDSPAARLGADNVRLAKHLTRQGAAIFTFLANPDVEATNWRAEQAIRPAVVNRKVWGGNRTNHGARTWERLVTVLTTCRQQGLDTLQALIDLAQRPAPALAIPTH